jgi:hypothetical protein
LHNIRNSNYLSDIDKSEYEEIPIKILTNYNFYINIILFNHFSLYFYDNTETINFIIYKEPIYYNIFNKELNINFICNSKDQFIKILTNYIYK